ncbi:MAG TPA: hypothetical protein VFW65_04245 [Pseudonocardiaceae bacterium]|nr:hypothetical protein [Pseudonocardiaceae bacterium]
MGAIVILVIIIGLIVMALQRNHVRQQDGRRTLDGSDKVTDRDAERVVVELEAARSQRSGGVTFADRPPLTRAADTARPHTLRDNDGAWTLRTVFAATSRGHRPHRT